MNNLARALNDPGFEALIKLGDSKKKPSGFDALLTGMASANAPNATTQSAGLLAGDSAGYLLSLMGQPAEDTSGVSVFDSIIGTSGPLPTFLREVVATRHLDAEHKYALYAITARNMDIVKTPDSVRKLAMELQEAGI